MSKPYDKAQELLFAIELLRYEVDKNNVYAVMQQAKIVCRQGDEFRQAMNEAQP